MDRFQKLWILGLFFGGIVTFTFSTGCSLSGNNDDPPSTNEVKSTSSTTTSTGGSALTTASVQIAVSGKKVGNKADFKLSGETSSGIRGATGDVSRKAPDDTTIEVYSGTTKIFTEVLGSDQKSAIPLLASGDYKVVFVTSKGKYPVNVTVGGTTFPKKTVSYEYFAQTKAQSGFTTAVADDNDGDGEVDVEDAIAKKELVSGDGSPNVVGDSFNDTDGDGVPNSFDEDIDGDGTLNGADSDVDGDGVANGADSDVDGDGVANVDDRDTNGDGDANSYSNDVDGDGIANSADTDIDGDGVLNGSDTDVDGDGLINSKDADIDGDQKINIRNPVSLEPDGDTDGDGLDNDEDADMDGDGTPNVNDADIDGDGDANSVDIDVDGDGDDNQGDADVDGDGVANTQDSDVDGDGISNSIRDRELVAASLRLDLGGSNVIGTAPTGWTTVGFPVASTTISIASFSSTNTAAIILVNTSNTELTVALTASMTTEAPDASIKPLPHAQIALEGISGHRKHEGDGANNITNGEDLKNGGKTHDHSVVEVSRANLTTNANTVGQQETFRNSSGKEYTATVKSVTDLPTKGKFIVMMENSVTTDTTAFLNEVLDYWNGSKGQGYSATVNFFGQEPFGGGLEYTQSNETIGDDLYAMFGPAEPLGTSAGTAGFFWAGDLCSRGDESDWTKASNRRKIVYVIYNPSSPPTVVSAASTLVHEYFHLQNYMIRKYIHNKSEALWLNEALGTLSSEIAGFTLAKGDDEQIGFVEGYLNGIQDHNMIHWGGQTPDYGRGLAFCYFVWKKFPTKTFKDMINSTKVSIEGIESVTGETFANTLVKYHAALYFNDSTDSTTALGLNGVNLAGANSGKNLPGVKVNKVGTYPYSSGSVKIKPYSAYYLEFNTGNGTYLQISVPTGVTTLAANK